MAETSAVARSPIAPTPPEVVVDGWAVSARRSAAALTLTDHDPARQGLGQGVLGRLDGRAPGCAIRACGTAVLGPCGIACGRARHGDRAG
ncbi:MAG: hypothetical protein WKF83_03150 [Nocardioidaceae bacterium]